MRLLSLVRTSLLALPVALAPLAACDGETTNDGTGGLDASSPGFEASAPPTADAAVRPPDAAPSPPVDAATADANDGGKTSGGLQFDGVDDIVELPAAAGAANDTAMSVELWFATTKAQGTMFEVYAGTSADRFLLIDAGMVCWYVFGTPIRRICTPNAGYDDGAWHHVAGTLGAASGMKLYVDGVSVASAATPTTSNFTFDTNFRLGYGHTDFNSALVYFGGALDEVRLWSVERTEAEIVANYKGTIAPATAGLQGYWKLDETGAATIAKDAVPNGHDGTLVNFPTATSPWVPGAF